MVPTAEAVATSLASGAEVAAALARAVRLGVVDRVTGQQAQYHFSEGRSNLLRIPVTEELVARAQTLAWEHGLRGYDAIHLASALTWNTVARKTVVVATFDFELSSAARQAGLQAWPERL